MSIIGSFDRTQHLNELNFNLQTPSGNLTPAQRRARTIANLGMTAASMFVGQATPGVMNTSATATAAQLLTGLITSTTAAAVALTLPLATDLEIALLAQKGSALAVGDGFQFTLQATGANAITVTTNTGWTLAGTMAVATLTSGTFRVFRTAANAYTVYRV